tara:strand:- start:688 stop:1125 length:438 start_codon:yes stop_codon:yes gene_type:complete
MYGTSRQKLDSNGRISIPLKHLQSFNADSATGTGHGVLVTGEDGCIELFPLDAFNDEIKKTFVISENSRDSDTRMQRRRLIGNAYGVDIDERGRLSIPNKYREFARLHSGSVILSACGDYLEIWSPDTCPELLLEFLAEERIRQK